MALTLEELIGKQALDEIKGKPFGINSADKYDRKEFVKSASDLFDIEEYYSALRENSSNMDALNDLIGVAVDYMAGDKKANAALLQENPHAAIEEAEVLYSYGSIAMAKYIENNRREVLDKLDAKQLNSVFQRVPLQKTGDKEYDRIRDLREKIMQMQKASEEKGDIGDIIRNELNELIEQIPEEQKIFLSRTKDLSLPILQRAIIDRIQKAYALAFRDKEGNLDKEKLRKCLVANYKVTEDYMKNEIPSGDEKEKFKIWDKNLKSHYLELARELYKPEKKTQKEKDDPDKEKRKSYAASLGIRT